MKLLVIIFALLVCAIGCATVTGTQSACLAKNQYFREVAQCIWSKKLAHYSTASRSAIADYEAHVALLEQRVSSGQMTDAQAKLALQAYLERWQAAYSN